MPECLQPGLGPMCPPIAGLGQSGLILNLPHFSVSSKFSQILLFLCTFRDVLIFCGFLGGKLSFCRHIRVLGSMFLEIFRACFLDIFAKTTFAQKFGSKSGKTSIFGCNFSGILYLNELKIA